ncbi:MAG: hypothetical protein AAGI22_20555 [Planctomycetota bacterium]
MGTTAESDETGSVLERGAGTAPSEPSPGGPEGAPAGHASPPRRRRTGRRILLTLALLVVAVLAAGPPLASSWLRDQIELRGSERVDGTVTLAGLSISLNGKAVAEGLTVVDSAGDVVLHVPRATVDLGLRSILSGRKDIALLVEGAEVELVRDAEGSWNLQDILTGGSPAGESAPKPDRPKGERAPAPQEPPEIHGRLELVDATVVVRSPETALELRDVHFTVGLDGPGEETAVRLDATLFGGDGSVGTFYGDVAVWPDGGPGLRMDEVSVRGLELGAVEEAMKLVGAALPEGSSLAGEVDLVVGGSLADLDPSAPFEVAANGVARALDVALAREDAEPFELREDMATLELHASGDGGDAEPRATAKLRARNGRLAGGVAWDGAAESGLSVTLDVDAIEASAGFEPLLARVHPAFAGAQAFDGADLGGLVSSRVEMRYDAPLSLQALTSGDFEFDDTALAGTGSLSVDEGLVQTSAFFGEILRAFGEPTNPSFDLKPLGFALDGGRLAYSQPWTWTIEGTETRFVGTVGLDKTLDLAWEVPISGAIAQKNSFLRSLEGETFEVGLGGTLTSPSFDVAGALSSLARRAAERKLQSEIGRGTEDLQDALEDAVGSEAGADAIRGILEGDAKAVDDAAKRLLGNDAEPADLLKEADRLWDAGKKQDAATIYRRIRKDFPLSPTYLFNKKKIKGRRNG